MKTAVFDTRAYDETFLSPAALAADHELVFLEPRLTTATAVLARGCPAVCSFVNDRLDEERLQALAAGGTRFIALRSAGYNHVDLAAAARLSMRVARAAEYSPHAVAEHTFALLLALVGRRPARGRACARRQFRARWLGRLRPQTQGHRHHRHGSHRLRGRKDRRTASAAAAARCCS